MQKTVFLIMTVLLLVACSAGHLARDVKPLKEAGFSVPDTDSKLEKLRVLEVHQNPALLRYLKEVRSANKSLKALAATVQASQFGANAESGRRAPEIGLGVNGKRQKSSNEELANKPQNNVDASLNASWTLDVWGKLSDEAQAAQLIADQDAFNLVNTQNTLVAEAASLWLDLWLARREQNNLEQRMSFARNLENIAAEQYRQGLIDYGEYATQSLTASELRSQMLENQASERQALHRLNILRGLEPGAPLELSDDDLQPVLVPVPSAIGAEHLAARPDIQSSFARLQMMDAQTRAAYKAMLPKFTISTDFIKSGKSLAGALSSGWLWQLVGNITHPLFNGRQLRNQARQQSKQAEAALFDYEQLVLTSMEEVANALVQEQTLYEKWREAQKRQKNLMTQTRFKKQSYLDGDTSINDYVLVRQDHLSAQDQVAAALSTLLKNRISLSLALGMAVDQ